MNAEESSDRIKSLNLLMDTIAIEQLKLPIAAREQWQIELQEIAVDCTRCGPDMRKPASRKPVIHIFNLGTIFDGSSGTVYNPCRCTLPVVYSIKGNHDLLGGQIVLIDALALIIPELSGESQVQLNVCYTSEDRTFNRASFVASLDCDDIHAVPVAPEFGPDISISDSFAHFMHDANPAFVV